ncbi:hypothetical protein AVEN_251832-1, partial [Araneus ventricosus]
MLFPVIFFFTILFSELQPSRVHDHLRVRRQSPSKETPVIFPEMEEIPENQCIAYDGGVGLCRPAGLCVFRFDSVKDLEESACTMDNGKIGNCCPSKPPPSRVN